MLSFISNSPKLPPVQTFTGTMRDYLQQHSKMPDIQGIRVTNEPRPGANLFTPPVDIPDQVLFQNFMEAVNRNKIKQLSFDWFRMLPQYGYFLGLALNQNRYLESLTVSSSHLKKKGMEWVLNGICANSSLKDVTFTSFNITRYHWDRAELMRLQDIIRYHPRLTQINVPDNELNDFSDVHFLLEVYQHTDKKVNLASVSGFGVASSISLPPFCRENIEELDKIGRFTFTR